MDIKEIKAFCDDWDELTPDERVRVLLEDHCFCKDIKPLSISGDFAEYEVLPPNTTLNLFFGSLKDIVSDIGIKLQDGERVRLELCFTDLTFEVTSKKHQSL